MVGQEALVIIKRYKEHCLFRPYISWDKYDFMYRSYIRWVTEELIELITRNMEKDPYDLISHFMLQMDDWYERSKQGRPQTLFSIARDGSRDILELLDKYELLKGETSNEYVSIDPMYQTSNCYDAEALAWYSDLRGHQRLCDDCGPGSVRYAGSHAPH